MHGNSILTVRLSDGFAYGFEASKVNDTVDWLGSAFTLENANQCAIIASICFVKSDVFSSQHFLR